MEESVKKVTVSRKENQKWLNNLKKASSEKGVEHAYWKIVSKAFNTEQPQDSNNTDGYITVKYIEDELFLLMEFKYNSQLNKRTNALRVLIQVLFYMRNLSEKIAKIPNMILIGDQKNAFVMSTKPLIKYLEREDIDWNISPSNAPANFPDLLADMSVDGEIQYFLYRINSDFEFNDILDELKLILSNSNEKIRLTPNNINIAFDRFISDVIINRSKFSAEELVEIFITVAIEREKVFRNDTSYIKVNHHKVQINKVNYDSFINHFEETYKPSEKRKFTSISDRLIQDVERRSNGEFFTPSSFVKYSQTRLENYLGKNWNNDFVVWDVAWGTGNLTRDRNFKKLFASTLHQSDLNQGSQYNKGAEKFVFNFLEDDFDFENDSLFQYESDKLPHELIEILVNHPQEKFLFYLNPPYATASNAGSSVNKSKSGISKTKIQEEMSAQRLKVQEQLYAQFIYRIIKIKKKFNLENVYMGLFSPSLFLTGTKFKKFRELMFSNFEFLEGNLLQASNFADVKSNWAIDFSIWKSGDFTINENIPREFKHNVVGLNEFGEVIILDEKLLWNTDSSKSLQEYLTDVTDKKSELSRKVIQFKSRYKTNDREIEVPQNSIGFLINDTNNVEATTKYVYLMSSPITSNKKTAIITESTFDKQMVVFSSRKVITPTWINQKDEFLAPDELHPNFKSLVVKSVIYSIFSPSNNIISYREGYMGFESLNLNPWFFMSSEEIQKLADENNNDDIFNDTIEYSTTPYVLKFLNENKEQLDRFDNKLITEAKKIVIETFKYRNIVNDDNPNLSINTWDASWNQIIQVAKTYKLDLLTDFDEMLIEYKESLSELVYENGILKYD